MYIPFNNYVVYQQYYNIEQDIINGNSEFVNMWIIYLFELIVYNLNCSGSVNIKRFRNYDLAMSIVHDNRPSASDFDILLLVGVRLCMFVLFCFD